MVLAIVQEMAAKAVEMVSEETAMEMAVKMAV